MEKAPLTELVEQHLAAAREAASGRSAHTLFGGHSAVLRQTLVALLGGRRLAEHENPGEATLQVLSGQVRLVPASAGLASAELADNRADNVAGSGAGTGGPNAAVAAAVGAVEGSAGDLLVVPDARHSLEALTDAVILLTVAKLPD